MLTYCEDAEEITDDALVGFFEGWPTHPDSATQLRILRGSDVVVLALDGAQVVGFVTAITDGVLSAYIPLLEVLPAYRRHGVAHELMQRLLARLDGLYMIDTCCDDDLVAFYEQFGMQQSGAAMVRRDHGAQTGRGGTISA